MVRTDEEIKKKIDELVDDKDNFIELNIDYCNGDSEIIFDSCETKRTLENFVKWLNDEK